MGWERQKPEGRVSRSPVVDEWVFIPDSIEQARDLYQAMVDAGTPPPRARHIVAWLIVKPPRAKDDVTSRPAQSEYRKTLAELGAPPWEMGEEEASAAAGVG